MDQTVVLPSSTHIISEEEFKGTYEIRGLYPGYGHTLGNSIRRILLSSLPGAAVTQVKIDGVSHEFSTIPNVLEDVVLILLNIKQLRFHLHGDEPQTAIIDVGGAKEVKGKDIKCPTQLEVINKDHHIATLTAKNAHLRLELTVERGIGFVPSENIMREKVAVGTLLLDAIFTPIRKVNYEVENMRVGDRTDYNRLRLTIETDGTIKPREALQRSLEIMQKQIERIASFEEESETQSAIIEESKSSSLLAPLGLTPKIERVLLEAELSTPEALSQKTAEEILALEGVGAKALADIKKGLEKIDLTLRESA